MRKNAGSSTRAGKPLSSPKSDRTNPPPDRDAAGWGDRRLLLFILLNILAVNAGFKLIAHFVFHRGVDEMRVRYWDFLHFHQFTDSWTPMLGSVNCFLAHPNLAIYQAKLYDTLIYPLTSILPLLWMKQAGMSDASVLRALLFASWLAVVGVVAVQVLIAARISASQDSTGRGGLSWRGVVATAFAAFFFMPITLAFSLGQAQIFLDLFFSLLVLFWVERRERAAGVMMALLAMVKPQFGLLLLWSALRRRWNALAAGVATLAVGGAASLAVFGLRNNLDYLGVLSGLSRKAQSHYANQSIFGLLNRAIFNGENLPYHPYVYPPFVPWIYHVTLATTVVLVLLALTYPWRERAGGMADLAAIGVVCVIATPMAWEHHYGVMLPIFAWLWFAVYRRGGRRVWALALAWVLIADFLSPFNLLAAVPVANVLQSYMYFGALLLLGLLLRSHEGVLGERATEPVSDSPPLLEGL
ncbi:MAG: glycosyltransferase family 87 protein [Acidobacteriaceae bacterium]|nr:glycosyltransferase family 87 protein [Acidobacteriaceae bacterium]